MTREGALEIRQDEVVRAAPGPPPRSGRMIAIDASNEDEAARMTAKQLSRAAVMPEDETEREERRGRVFRCRFPPT